MLEICPAVVMLSSPACACSANAPTSSPKGDQCHVRPLSIETVAGYIESGEWEGRAGACPSRARQPSIERIDGDYLNVVRLPGALLSLLERHAQICAKRRR